MEKNDHPILDIYYDNPNEASDMYLKWLKKDCETNGIEVRMFDNEIDWVSEYSGDGELFLEPTIKISDYYKQSDNNVDCPSATATGIYNWITTQFPNREENILVIGRGLVGKQLIDMLIDYGYTVVECNSKTPIIDLRTYSMFCRIVVGLATEQVFDDDWCQNLIHNQTILIDSGNNFDTKDKLRCGKWTREVIINRVKENYG